ncbi:5'-nucleotidase, lipoprotein e(P4) family [Rhodohalobacter halophilus]|uniref:5'-nucleotidase, lipoprotein e(P4) family n=1 Tax=Rhodohalobacter halophilus TaxID=1812810 RepID=UPI00083FD7EE|nr:HAD family acid phosphatase [Rhodohalobacter halophilus]
MKIRLLTVALLLLFTSCQTSRQAADYSNNTLSSTLWLQTAAEYEAMTLQAYNTARMFLTVALEDSTWSASLEQEDPYFDKPPAIILDLDETAIDNSFYEARVILDKSGFDSVTWNNWVREAEAEAIKGAVELTNRADELGIAVFYITNRDAEVQPYTEQNLLELGFPVAEGSVMSNGGQPGWTSAKTERRKVVAENYRVLMLFGDDLNDFVPARGISIEERKKLAEVYADWWGAKWFVLPNPNYGSWERALYTGNEESEAEMQQTRLNRLKDKRN